MDRRTAISRRRPYTARGSSAVPWTCLVATCSSRVNNIVGHTVRTSRFRSVRYRFSPSRHHHRNNITRVIPGTSSCRCTASRTPVNRRGSRCPVRYARGVAFWDVSTGVVHRTRQAVCCARWGTNAIYSFLFHSFRGTRHNAVVLSVAVFFFCFIFFLFLLLAVLFLSRVVRYEKNAGRRAPVRTTAITPPPGNRFYCLLRTRVSPHVPRRVVVVNDKFQIIARARAPPDSRTKK